MNEDCEVCGRQACLAQMPGVGATDEMAIKCWRLGFERLKAENASLRAEGEKDYADMRRFQSFYIEADHANRAALRDAAWTEAIRRFVSHYGGIVEECDDCALLRALLAEVGK